MLPCVPLTSDATSPAVAGSVSHELPGRKGTLPAGLKSSSIGTKSWKGRRYRTELLP
jgi:hypothetical protein